MRAFMSGVTIKLYVMVQYYKALIPHRILLTSVGSYAPTEMAIPAPLV